MRSVSALYLVLNEGINQEQNCMLNWIKKMKSKTEWNFLAYANKVGAFKKPKVPTNSINIKPS
jgi:hypothetical protein